MTLRPFHQASWNEPILLELSSPGERGLVLVESDDVLAGANGDPLAGIPDALRRSNAPGLPELSQPQILRHYLRLSQETLGNDVNVHLGLGTCTMKYSPKVNEELVRQNVVHLYQEYPGAHDWAYWKTHLADTLLFFEQRLRDGAK